MAKKKRKNLSPREVLAFCDRVKELKVPLSTSIGAIHFLLLNGAGALSDKQKRFLEVAKKNSEKLFFELQKFIDTLQR
ncbi:MAG TPA: hypothetical protein PKL97_03220 [Candidatus Omnitrophota bacterium]|nr:hypothetical protein [Candidatus Omnitrophota bacterium]